MRGVDSAAVAVARRGYCGAPALPIQRPVRRGASQPHSERPAQRCIAALRPAVLSEAAQGRQLSGFVAIVEESFLTK